MKSYTYLKTKMLGELLLVATTTHLVGIYFPNHKHRPQLPRDWELNPGHAILRQAGEEIQEYLNGKRTSFSVPILFEGTGFQREIWRQIAMIPFGQTISYSELAQRANAPKAVRAAGAATGRNPLGIVVPCHRVIGKNGSMTGFAGGVDRKKILLKIEAGQKLNIERPTSNARRRMDSKRSTAVSGTFLLKGVFMRCFNAGREIRINSSDSFKMNRSVASPSVQFIRAINRAQRRVSRSSFRQTFNL